MKLEANFYITSQKNHQKLILFMFFDYYYDAELDSLNFAN